MPEQTADVTTLRDGDTSMTDMHPDEKALHLTYDAYVTQGMEDHEHGSLRPDDFINRLLNAGVVVRLASILAPEGAPMPNDDQDAGVTARTNEPETLIRRAIDARIPHIAYKWHHVDASAKNVLAYLREAGLVIVDKADLETVTNALTGVTQHIHDQEEWADAITARDNLIADAWPESAEADYRRIARSHPDECAAVAPGAEDAP